MNTQNNPLSELNFQELKKLIETHKAINDAPYMISESSPWTYEEPVKVWCDSELTYMDLYSNGKSNILHHFWKQKLLENKRIADESIKLLLENNPLEEKYDLKNGILKIRPK